MHSHLGAGVTTDRRQLFYLFYFSSFCILFACLRFLGRTSGHMIVM